MSASLALLRSAELKALGPTEQVGSALALTASL
jgi:hypothetical protein